MPRANPNNRLLKSKMTLHGVLQKDILPLFKDKQGKTRSRSYLDIRMAGREDFTLSEALIFKHALNITDRQDFLDTFFPGEKWDA